MSFRLSEAVIHSHELDAVVPGGLGIFYRPDEPYSNAVVKGEAKCMAGNHIVHNGEFVYLLDEPLLGSGFTADTNVVCRDHLTLQIPTLTAVRARVFLDDPEATVTPQEE